MLSSWNRLVTKAGSNLATRSRTKRANVSNSRASSRSIQTSTAAAISTDVSNWSYLAIAGVGLAASAVFWTKTRKGVAAEEEEPFVVKAPAVLSNLKKDRAYIVGEAVLTGKNDSDPMLVPHEVRFFVTCSLLCKVLLSDAFFELRLHQMSLHWL
jgi:hypothetical protein